MMINFKFKNKNKLIISIQKTNKCFLNCCVDIESKEILCFFSDIRYPRNFYTQYVSILKLKSDSYKFIKKNLEILEKKISKRFNYISDERRQDVLSSLIYFRKMKKIFDEKKINYEMKSYGKKKKRQKREAF